MQKTVTIFGAGLVVKPMVDYLAKQGYNLVIASRTVSKAEKLAAPHPNATAKQFVATDEAAMEDYIRKSDLVVSLLPASLHVLVAKKCIALGKNMVTTSYISPQMRALDQQAKDAGIIILNEIGVDPGIDHMSAMKIFHHVQNNGGKIVSFMSYCGGLPALDVNTNPMGYKFSWAPKGVLLAAGNSGRYMRDGETVDVPGKDLFSHYWLVDVPGVATFEAYINRDSLPYTELYDLKHVKTMYRGTLRNVGHCETWFTLSRLGFFDDSVFHDKLEGTVSQFIAEHLLGLDKNADVETALADKFGLPAHSVILKKFGWLGFFDDSPLLIGKGSACDVLTSIMLDRMSYNEGERDLLAMHHEFVAEFPDKTQNITSTMVDYGIPDGDSSMSRTVSLPAAIAVRMILEGEITVKGVHMPVLPNIYMPVLNELENLGITLIERFNDV
ncbi:MAG: saccharopine dehydrogenase NADP-binding domain-containing protein [Candidatus Cloacimonetes bacterium]|nr:saccharopine dehydrogenase NADP-binding domain-containing protein [Candidatus Cloacimonadota bacterium]